MIHNEPVATVGRRGAKMMSYGSAESPRVGLTLPPPKGLGLGYCTDMYAC